MKTSYLSGSLMVLCSLSAYAEVKENTSASEESSLSLDAVLITGGEEEIQTLPGSAQLLDDAELEKFDYTDVNQVMTKVPGVYIRTEDGFGLRPNIGIRGVSPERSQKITIMEDGMLIGPAPYSAPAAYYFPNINRMHAVEVFKGPASIQYGPNTVGGAINLVTQPVPDQKTGEFDLSLGSDGFQKIRGLWGDSSETFGYLIEGLRYSSDGFKELDNGGDTGFVRNDVNVKLRFNTPASAEIQQQLVLKFGYADEDSDETYLGLSEADFARDPYQRYTASQLDRFESEHTQFHAIYSVDFNNDFSLISKLYFNQFERAWFKFDGLMNGFDTFFLLNNAEAFPSELDLLRGRIDSSGDDSSIINVTDFDREYGSYGLELTGQYLMDRGEWFHDLKVGIRFHHDYVERDHQIEGYLMQNGRLVDDGEQYGKKDLNEDSTDAFAIFVHDTIDYRNWTINAGLRLENIEGESDDQLSGESNSRSESVVIPGIGAYYQYNDSIGFLAGVNKGFSPNGPSASNDVDPEESVNYEFGLRYAKNDTQVEAIAFFSDYSNLISRCRTSDSSCNAGDEFNGGDVEIQGLELVAKHQEELGEYLVPMSLTYTYTESEFQSSFDSSFSQWGNVRAGDELPYLPNHLARLEIGLESYDWSVLLAANYVGEMREEAGQGRLSNTLHTEDYLTWDLVGQYDWSEQWGAQLKIINLTDEVEIVSRRPFGARPNAPQTIIGTIKYRF